MSKETVKNPTIFVIDGSIMNFEEGTIYELHMQITKKEWEMMAIETTQYKIFLDCLKTVAFPILHEKWTEEDEWWRIQLEYTLDKIKKADPLIHVSAGINEKTIADSFISKIKTSAAEVVEQIKIIRTQQSAIFDPSNITVSGL